MKNFLVIGNPIQHSLSPKLHNFWINQNNIDAHYEKKQIEENEISKVIQEIKDDKLSGINITVPYKKSVIPFLEKLSETAKITQSVNTVYKKDNKIVGDNTDVVGFVKSLENINLKGKSVLVLGAGGVVSSIIHGCYLLGVKNVFVSNRTQSKVDELIALFPEVKKINWGDNVLCDLIINSTSVGLKKDDKLNIDLSSYKTTIFYDVIYSPRTNFLAQGESMGNKTIDGKKMFVYQAQEAFKIWHNISPTVNQEVMELLI